MRLWLALTIGVAITIFLWILKGRNPIRKNEVLVSILEMVIVANLAGIADGWIISCGYKSSNFIDNLLGLVICAIVIDVALFFLFFVLLFGTWDNSMKHNKKKILFFVLMLIIATVCWIQPFNNYNDNIEEINETIVINEKENELFHFCNIPLQQISGSMSGSSSFGTGSISGSLSTYEELPYWYADKNGDAEYNSVPAENSKIRFIGDDETPYVEVITYRYQTRTVNHNDGTETIRIWQEWEGYIFYLPETIMQYQLE